MAHVRAIATLLIGEAHQAAWNRQCRANWEQYAARHGADVVVIDTPLDRSRRALARTPVWQKFLIPAQPSVGPYRQIVLLDADILIHPRAPWVGEGVPPERVGAVDEFSYPSAALYRRGLARLYRQWDALQVAYVENLTARVFHGKVGLPEEFDRVVQAGVLVLSSTHRELLEDIYERYEESAMPNSLYDMRVLSYELQRANLVYWLDPRFNAIWQIDKALSYPFLLNDAQHPFLSDCTTATLSRSHFLHFAGAHNDLESVALDSPRLAGVPRGRAPAPELLSWPCSSPVALMVSSEGQAASALVEMVRPVRPRRLFLIAAGVPAAADRARSGTSQEIVADVARHVDWECEVTIHDRAPASATSVEDGLDWLFGETDEAIVLDGGSICDITFFRFCDELLARYRDVEAVMAISAADVKAGLAGDPHSYAFSRYPWTNGWATWRRAWRLHDRTMRTFPHAMAAGSLEPLLGERYAVQYWTHLLHESHRTHQNWTYAWQWTLWEHHGLCVHPNVNLVEQVVADRSAPAPSRVSDVLRDLTKSSIAFPLSHPAEAMRNADADRLIEEIAFSGSVRRRLMRARAKPPQAPVPRGYP